MPTACINPPSLSPRVTSVGELAGTWYVAQTRPQYEKKLARELEVRGVDYFLPLVRIRKVYGNGKNRITVLPFFPLYVFVNGDADARYAADSSPCTAVMRNVSDQVRFAQELAVVEEKIPRDIVIPDIEMIHVGMRCRVKAGHSMQGCEGWIDEVTGRGRVVVAITMLGASRPVEIDPSYLEPA